MSPAEVTAEVELLAKALAQLEPDEPWPTNAELGGSLTGTRDDEFRDGKRDEARELLADLTTFTKGQKARRTHGSSRYIRIGEEVTVASVDLPALGEHWITLEGHGDKPFLADDFEPVDATPAPLDPKNVKAGDTVAVLIAPAGHAPTFTVTGEAYVLGPDAEDLWVGPYPISDPRHTLTDHQPAPEPEPEWGPGTFGWADVPAPHGRAHGFLTDRNFVYLVDDDESMGYNVTSDFSNFNPDVLAAADTTLTDEES